MKKKKYKRKSIKTDPNGITVTCHITGNAAEIIRERISEVKEKEKAKQYGVQCAINYLLHELYKLKRSILPGQALTS